MHFIYFIQLTSIISAGGVSDEGIGDKVKWKHVIFAPGHIKTNGNISFDWNKF